MTNPSHDLPDPTTSQPSPDVAGIVERRPLFVSSAVTSSEPGWQVINDAFARWGFTAPPTRMRDELVNHLQWARFGFEAASVLTENKTLREERDECKAAYKVDTAKAYRRSQDRAETAEARVKALEEKLERIASLHLPEDPPITVDEEVSLGSLVGAPPYRWAIGDDFIREVRAALSAQEGK
jgi:hypothetical protein